MAIIPDPPDLGRIKDPSDFIRHASNAIKNTVNTVNGQLEFDKNLNTQTVTVTFPKANTDLAIPHTLGRVADNYLVSKASVSANIVSGKTASTSTTTYLQSSVAGTFTLILH